jgi:hypothetical protein
MEQIYEPNDQFPFDKLILTNPIFVNSGTYFIKYLINDAPLYIQPPKCITRQSFMKAGKKLYCDLLFTNENESFIQWMEDLENYSQKYIFNNRTKWFETDLEMHDIENSFTSPMKLYKSGKYYIVRAHVPTRLGKSSLRIYDEQEIEVPIDCIQDGTKVMTILEVQGIKCSTRSFQIDLEIKQMMIIPKSTLFERCVISKRSEENITSIVPIQDQPQDQLQDQAQDQLQDQAQDQLQDQAQDQHQDQHQDQLQDQLQDQAQDKPQNESNTLTETFKKALDMIVDDTVVQSPNVSTDESSRTCPKQDEENLLGEVDDINPHVQSEIELPQIEEVDFEPMQVENSFEFKLKPRNDVYYELYMTAKQKAEEARNLAISAYLEAKRIKDLYKIQEPLDLMSDISSS